MELILNDLRSIILQVRGENVILDKDIARLYGVTTSALNQAVKRNMNISWAPLPKLASEDTNKVALTGSALGLSKNIKEENIAPALTLAMLWSARYTESRQDTLLFDLGLSAASCEQYISLCEKEGALLSPDKKLISLINEGDTDSVKQRAELLNKRYAK